MRDLILYARLYHQWGFNIIPMKTRKKPAIPWLEYSRRQQDVRELEELVAKARVGLAVVTGPYNVLNNLVIDLDMEFLSVDERRRLAKQLVSHGLVVAETPRGLRVLARVNSPMDRVAVEYNGRLAGEGASRGVHLWTMPPTAEGPARYCFVLPNNKRACSFTREVMALEPPKLALEELASILELYGVTLVVMKSTVTTPISGAEPRDTVKRPLFRRLDDLLRAATAYPLPAAVAKVISFYMRQVGHPAWKRVALASGLRLEDVARVQHGERFLVASEFVLFIAHLVERVTLDEVYKILAEVIADWPTDAGEPLDRKLARLVVMDEKGFIHPRYGGLGAIRPPLTYCSRCFYQLNCNARGAKPWIYYRQLARGLEIAKKLGSNAPDPAPHG